MTQNLPDTRPSCTTWRLRHPCIESIDSVRTHDQNSLRRRLEQSRAHLSNFKIIVHRHCYTAWRKMYRTVTHRAQHRDQARDPRIGSPKLRPQHRTRHPSHTTDSPGTKNSTVSMPKSVGKTASITDKQQSLQTCTGMEGS